jgi:ribosomal protein L29
MSKNTKATSLKGKDHKDLKEMLTDKSKRLSEFKAEVTSGKIKNVKEGREIRKDIARILTELNTSKI